MHESLPETDLWECIYTRRPVDLCRLTDLADWRVAEGEFDIRGWTVYDQENRWPRGTVYDLLVSVHMSVAIFIMLHTGQVIGESDVDYGLHAHLDDRCVLVPLDRIELDEADRRALLICSLDDLQNAPQFDPAGGFDLYYDYWSQA